MLYGKVCEFIARECVAAAETVSVPLMVQADSGARESAADADEQASPVRDTHARWLTTPRDDLRGQAPRDVLLARRDHVERDLQDRSEQWSLLHECPPGLSPRSAAYRLGGFGTNEIVLYYDMVRLLMEECWARIEAEGQDAVAGADEAARLKAIQERWLQTPNRHELHGHTPEFVIDQERARLPWGVAAKEAMHDPDCPCCQMMADLPGPMLGGPGLALVDPTAERFNESLDAIGQAHPDLLEQCGDLQQRVRVLAARVTGGPAPADEMPF